MVDFMARVAPPCGLSKRRRSSQRPGVENERVVSTVKEDDVEDVERAYRAYAGNQRGFAVAIERLEGEAARVDLAPLGHEGTHLLIDDQMTWKRFGAELRKAPLDAEEHPRTIEEHARFESLSHEAYGLEHVDQADRAFEGDRVKSDERLLAGLGFDIFEDLLFVVDEEVAFLVSGQIDGRHDRILSRLSWTRRAGVSDSPNLRQPPTR